MSSPRQAPGHTSRSPWTTDSILTVGPQTTAKGPTTPPKRVAHPLAEDLGKATSHSTHLPNQIHEPA